MCVCVPAHLSLPPAVHQAESLPDSHSLHLTLSANQGRHWAAFLEEALPRALAAAARKNKELRRTLDREVCEYMGVTHERDAAGECRCC